MLEVQTAHEVRRVTRITNKYMRLLSLCFKLSHLLASMILPRCPECFRDAVDKSSIRSVLSAAPPTPVKTQQALVLALSHILALLALDTKYRTPLISTLGGLNLTFWGPSSEMVLLTAALNLVSTFPLTVLRALCRMAYMVVYIGLVDMYVRLPFKIRNLETRRDAGLVSLPSLGQ